LSRRLYLLFFLSGMSGLIYQVIWVREFGTVFGNTVYSAAAVTAVFMCGLGVGSLAAGRWIDRRWQRDPAAPLRAYGFAETLIGLGAFVVLLVLPRLVALSGRFTAYAPDAEGWLEPTFGSLFVRDVFAILLMGPITFLMGATLTLLIRHVVGRELDSAGWRIGLLYGLNTLGAAVGALLTDFILIPAAGLSATSTFAVALNLAAGFFALRLAKRVGPISTSAIEGDASEARGDGPRVSLTALALALSGFAGMGMEIVWYRVLSNLSGHVRTTYSALLAVILVGIFLGAMTGGWLHRRFGRAPTFYVLGQGLFIAASLFLLAEVDRQAHFDGIVRWMDAYAAAGPVRRALIAEMVLLRPIVAAVGLPALLMGFSYPLANATVQRAESSVGGRSGILYLANTVGAVAGSLVTGFVLLPAFGMQHAALWVMAAGALGLVPYLVATMRDGDARVLRPAFGLMFVLAIGALAAWARLPSDHLLRQSFFQISNPDTKVLSIREGVNETIAVTEEKGDRYLNTDGFRMSGTSISAQRYMRAFAHVPLLQRDKPTSVLVVCFGVGNTAHAASLHDSVSRLEVVDLSKDVLREADEFRATNGGIIHDPKVTVFVNDGRNHILAAPAASYDLVTLEPPPITLAGVASLYSSDFYAIVKSRLKPGGYLSQWLPAYQTVGDNTLSAIRAFIDVFPNTVLLSGSFNELILLGINADRIEIDPDQVERRLAEAPRVKKDLEPVELDSAARIVAMFASSPRTLVQATSGSVPVTDDYPIMEYGVVPWLTRGLIPPQLFDVEDVGAWCPKCLVDGELRQLLGESKRIYRSEAFLRLKP
jgi:spermidine synthase